MRMINVQKLHQRQNHSSRSSRGSSKSSSSANSKLNWIDGKIKLAELLAWEAFLEKRQQVKNEVQRLMMPETLKSLRMWSLVKNRNY